MSRSPAASQEGDMTANFILQIALWVGAPLRQVKVAEPICKVIIEASAFSWTTQIRSK